MRKLLEEIFPDESILSQCLIYFCDYVEVKLEGKILAILLSILLIPAILLETVIRVYILVLYGLCGSISYLRSKVKELITKWRQHGK